MKKRILFICVLCIAGTCSYAQFGKVLGKAVENAAKSATVRKAQQKTDQVVGKTIDKVTDPATYKGDGSKDSKNDAPSESDNAKDQSTDTSDSNVPVNSNKNLEMTYSKSDFVPGDVIFFDDDVSGEKPGEFPSQWDLESGAAEIVSIEGKKSINLHKGTAITPLMKNKKEYIPDVFTMETDFFLFGHKRYVLNDTYHFSFNTKENRMAFRVALTPGHDDTYLRVKWDWVSPEGERKSGEQKVLGVKAEEFHRLSISFNKRALKVYINGERTANVPNVIKPSQLEIKGYGSSENAYFIKDIRLSEGAVPLYDRMMTDGKIISYGINFDIGKSSLKPESMGEINRISQLMKDNPELKFSVEGHTDNTGTADSNQKLSDARSQAVMDKLIEMGISKDRLKSAGKGQNSPIADNSTDDGRAKNRRVEFVKI